MITINNPKECCGCTACVNVCTNNAIHMQANEKGFLYPYVNPDKCVQCGLCEVICPIKNREKNNKNNKSVKKAYALRLKNRETLFHSSSGGAFFALASYVIDKGGVVFGAIYDDNMVVKHSYASTIEDCKKFQGSKYSQSDLSDTFTIIKEILKKNRVVLFSGTPCQNHGLLQFLRKPYNNLITVDVVCHSVPSPLIFSEYIKMIEKKYGDRLLSISMRDKTLGWGNIESYKYYFHSGKEILNPKGIKCWQQIFESGLITRESCFDCHYTDLKRVTDFTIGDFWDSHNLRPDIRSKEGTSIILINTKKGEKIFGEIKNSVLVWELTEKEFLQPRLMVSTLMPEKYDLFWTSYNNLGYKKTYSLYFSEKNLCSRIIHQTKKLLLFVLKRNENRNIDIS